MFPFSISYSIAGPSIAALVKNILDTDGDSPNNGFVSLTQLYCSPLYVVQMSANCNAANVAHLALEIGSVSVNCNWF